ncbi:MAG TPA: penicillin acylase family protein, partial [Thermoanaerobaculia bacterium]|nr:penicillin acylase family protein [Thermoanaerobaculia bacterium]
NDRDALFVLGWVHAQDRFFQMDLLRRTFSGTLGELVGDAALPQDVQLRTLGLRRAAEASLPAQTRATRVWLGSYAAGVNAWLADPANPLPPEYTALELTKAAVPPWTPVDSLAIAKGLAFGLSFDLSDIDLTVAAATFQVAGAFGGFDGAALFSEDVFRSAPFDPTVSIPGFTPAAAPVAGEGPKARARAAELLSPKTLELARSYRERAARVPLLERALRPAWERRGSNWWIAAGSVTESGFPILANDPHLGLDTPSIFYEAQIRVRAGAPRPPMNAFGVTFPGIPGIVLGCNLRACWGATTNPMDVTDVYLEALVLDPDSGLPVATVFEGAAEPLVAIPQTFRVNLLDGAPDTVVDAGVGPLDGGVTLIVPRRNMGPIVALDLSEPDAPVALSVQYTGWGPTQELDAFQVWHRVGTVEEFREALQFFDVGSQNFAYADVAGNIAYFTSAEMPLREDLQLLQAPDGGIPPFFIRDGTHTLRHEWLPDPDPGPRQSLPYQVLPFDEMPQVVNPPAGYVLNANNDPVGTTLDNNPLNQLRPGGGLYYLSPGYASAFRAGRIRREIERLLSTGDGKLSVAEMQALQANHALLDAEVLVPYVAQAFANAQGPGASPALAAVAADPEVAEAAERLAAWDFTTPTGIPEGYDPGDDPTALPAPSPAEVDASVAATLYSVWRGQAVQRVIDGTLAGAGLDGFGPGSSIAVAALRHHLDAFPVSQGFGASGLDFFPVPGVSRQEARDVTLLESLRAALDLLASDAFAPAFGNSTDQDDYRWGKLHRITFDHPLGPPFSIPPAAGLPDLGPNLPGIARSGGFGAVDASSHNARADSAHEFTFGSGPARRFVGEMRPDGPAPLEVIPGGQSGVLGHPFYGSQLPLWLTNQYHPFPFRPDEVVGDTVLFEVFLPE